MVDTILLNSWMNQQQVSFTGAILACCSPTKARRRYARMALFKRFTVEELERRYQKEQARLSHKESQMIRQTIEKFKRGWYINVSIKHQMGTFYVPWSPLFSLVLFFIIPCISPALAALMPFTSLLIRSLLRKDNHNICVAYMMAPFFPLLILMDVLCLLVYITMVVLVLLLIALLVEPLVIVVGMCWYGRGRLEEFGVFVYRCKVWLITAQGKASRTYTSTTGSTTQTTTRTVRLTKYDVGGDLTLPRASLCRTIFNNPIVDIFENLNWSEYSYGEMADHLCLSAQEIKMYKQRCQECEALNREAELMA